MEKNKQNFFEKYDKLNEKDFRLELLWSQKITHGKLHRIRKNLTRIFWVCVTLLMAFILTVLLFRGNFTN